ncbi:unnamed protein product [Lactuca saligna]|uniref:Uncharacterized protein n=1 Tax=Lactuca saligna TaxID=75948 RepID=A0AA36A2L0_LACSI|nr:unnamed protein product [Lactuca saligna]
MENFQTTYNSNTTFSNEALKSLGSLFKNEKTKLQELPSGLKTDHEYFQAPLSSHLSQLKTNLRRKSLLRILSLLKPKKPRCQAPDMKLCRNRSMICYLRGKSCEVVFLIKPLIRTKGRKDDWLWIKKGNMAGRSRKVEPKAPKAPVKPIVKPEPKDKETLLHDELLIDNDSIEEITEEELKRQKLRAAEMDEH